MTIGCEQFANDALTSLAADVSLVDTTIEVVSIAGFPLSTPFRIMINNEIMMVTGIFGNFFTVTRGLEDTEVATHLTGAGVSQVLTNGSIFGFSECRFPVGPRASRPSPELEGRVYFTQYPGWYFFRENGLSWRAWGPTFQLYEGLDYLSNNWNWINVNDNINPFATLTEDFGDLCFATPPNLGAGENIRLFTEPVSAEAPIAPPYTVIAGFSPCLTPVNQTCCGIAFRESTTDKFIIFRLMYDDTSVAKRDLVISLDKYDDPNTFNSNYKVLSAGTLLSSLVFFRMEDDGTNLNWYFSNDGLNFALFDTQLRADFLASGPDEIGIAFGTNNSTGSAGMTLHSWLKV